MICENEKPARVDVYLAEMPEGDVVYPVFPRQREDELLGVSSVVTRREKYHAWRLLEYALRASLGLSMEQAAPYRSGSGKWMSALAEFSISHAGGVVAVAVSKAPVGIDVEKCGRTLDRGFAERMLTDRELSSLKEGDDEILSVWCKKEALFKMRGEARFIPRGTESFGEPIHLEKILLPSGEYMLAVSPGAEAKVTVNICRI